MHERERVKLARSLHDGIAQDLVGLSYRLQAMLSHDETPPHLRAEIRESIFGIDQLSSKVRDEIFALRNTPAFITVSDLQSALLERNDELLIDFHSTVNPTALIPWQVLQVCQELLQNACRHARATRIEFTLTLLNNRYECTVLDDGAGEISRRAGHYGLVGMQELLSEVGGELLIDQGGSRRITVHFPHTRS